MTSGRGTEGEVSWARGVQEDPMIFSCPADPSSNQTKASGASFFDVEDEEPASLPTALVEADAAHANLTALPAPPLMPLLSTFDPQIPRSTAVSHTLALVASVFSPSSTEMTYVAPPASLRVMRGIPSSCPPSGPPPGASARRAA
jgi:hypothetical protein